MKNKITYHLGNAFMLLSLAGFIWIFYPVISVYLWPPHIMPVKAIARQKDPVLTIPKIHAQAKIVEQVDPRNETEYMQALKKGVAQAKGTSLPGQHGTSFIFAHSSGAPWDMTYMNTIFLRLGELNRGDTIIIERNGITYHYRVREKKEVQPTDVSYLSQNKRTQLILQTCTPIGTSLRRLLVFADPSKK